MATQVIWSGNDQDGFYTSHLVTGSGRHTQHGHYGPPTGRTFVSRTIADCMVHANKIYREWIVADTMAILTQLGLDPHPFAEQLARGLFDKGLTATRHRREPPDDRPVSAGKRADLEIAATELERETLRWLHEVFNRRMFGKIKDVYAPTVQFHGPLMKELYGVAAVMHQTIGLVGSFPDAAFAPQHICSTPCDEGGTKVAVRWIMEGHHIGYGLLRPRRADRQAGAGDGHEPLPLQGRQDRRRVAGLRRAVAADAAQARANGGRPRRAWWRAFLARCGPAATACTFLAQRPCKPMHCRLHSYSSHVNQMRPEGRVESFERRSEAGETPVTTGGAGRSEPDRTRNQAARDTLSTGAQHEDPSPPLGIGGRAGRLRRPRRRRLRHPRRLGPHPLERFRGAARRRRTRPRNAPARPSRSPRTRPTEHKNIQVAALTTNPATYTVAMVANNSVVPLLNDGLMRPLDDLVAKYGQDLSESQLIRSRRQGHGDRLHGRTPSTCTTARTCSRRPACSRRRPTRRCSPPPRSLREKGLIADAARRELQAGLGPRGGVREHVPRLRRRVLRAGHRQARRSTTRRASRRSRR